MVDHNHLMPDGGDTSALCICGKSGMFKASAISVADTQTGPLVELDNMMFMECIKCGARWLFDGNCTAPDGCKLPLVKYRAQSLPAVEHIASEKKRQWDDVIAQQKKDFEARAAEKAKRDAEKIAELEKKNAVLKELAVKAEEANAVQPT